MMNFLTPADLRDSTILPVLPPQNETLYNQVEGINFYRVVTDFYVNAMFGQLPRVDGDKEIFEAFENSVISRSVNGYGAVIRIPTQTFSVSGRYVWQWREDGIQLGWILGWPWQSSREVVHADRIRIFIHQFERPILAVLDFELTGNTLGRRIATNFAPGDVGVWGNGVNDYEPMKDAVKWFNTRMSRNATLLDRHSAPHLQGAVEARDEQGRFDLNPDGSFLPLAENSQRFEYLTWDSPEALNQFHLNTLIDLLHMITGVPATAFGLSSASGDSGVSRERQMFAAISKVRRWRRDIEKALEQFGVRNLDWVDDPFLSWMESVDAELKLQAAGTLTVNEVRRRLDLGEPLEETEPEQDAGEDEGEGE